MDEIFDIPKLKKKVQREWDVFCQELEQTEQVLEELEHDYIHVVDLADGHHGVYTFNVAYKLMEGEEKDIASYSFNEIEQEAFLDKWNIEVKDWFGEEYFIDWFHTDGSLSIFYRPIWDGSEVADDFAGAWAWSKGISPDETLREFHMREYLRDVEETIKREFLL